MNDKHVTQHDKYAIMNDLDHSNRMTADALSSPAKPHVEVLLESFLPLQIAYLAQLTVLTETISRRTRLMKQTREMNEEGEAIKSF